MKLIIGLGNPGRQYTRNRHNIGFLVVRSLAEAYSATLKRDGLAFSLAGKIKIGSQDVVLALPLTFMNLSGMAVAALLKKYKAETKDLLVVCDDLDLDFGRLKIRSDGSSAGQRGLESIIEVLGSRDFARLRLGIGRPPRHVEPAEYVLSDFKKKEESELKEVLAQAQDCCESWGSLGIIKTMNIYNRRS